MMPKKLKCSASALTMELSRGYNFYLDILSRKPPRLLWYCTVQEGASVYTNVAKTAKNLGPGDHHPPPQRVWIRRSLHCKRSLDHELKQLWEFHVLPGKI